MVPRILRFCYLSRIHQHSVNAGVRRLGNILSSCRASRASCSFVTTGCCVKIVFVKEGGLLTHSHLATRDYTAELGGGSLHTCIQALSTCYFLHHLVSTALWTHCPNFHYPTEGRQIHHWRDGENRFLLFKALEPYLIFGQSSHPLDGLEGSLWDPTMVNLASHLATSSSNSVDHLTLGPLRSLGTGVVHLLTWSVPTLNS